ncbi:MlaD family protein [uncultured Roseobacter sp.]|uniref:MlaD family protein n=1 Tax=uncultured Roseobacter sp. TaxID=114847 RepID=UPI002616E6B0|nr:MlaD family protein [uncultured Roseobacter sp.]
MNDKPSPVSIETGKSPVSGRASMIWLIPLAALVIALFVAWQSFNARGPLISIQFETGAGITARQTELRFRDVKVGVVERVIFAEGLEGVVAEVRLNKDVAPYVDAGSNFWVVQPELSARGVTGLDTVLSGVFIEGSWDGEIGLPRFSFKGRTTAPLFLPGDQGLQIALRTIPGGTMSDDVPILYRGIEVGRVGPARISPEGNFAIAEAVIYAPHGRLITGATRFWDTSGFSVSIGPGGAGIDFSSIASLVGGGITFDTFVSGGEQIVDGTVFEVFADSVSARNSVFNASEVEVLEMRVIFDENISGLVLGAPVELSGLRIGTVESLSGVVDQAVFGDSRVRLSVVLAIQPARLGLPGDASSATALDFLTAQVEGGLRARLASGSLLTGGLKVELVEVPDAPPAALEISEAGMPVLPTTESEISDAAATVEGVFTRLNSLPIEDLLNSAIEFLDGARALVTDPALRDAPQEVRALLGDVRGMVTAPSVQEIPIALNAALVRLEALLAQLEEDQAVQKIVGAIDATTVAATSVTASVSGLPDLLDGLTDVAAQAEALPLEELTRQLTVLLASADDILSTTAAQDLPGSLAAALDELNATLAELRSGGAVENVNATLQSTREAADAIALSSQDLPALVDRITEVFDQASATIAGYDRGEALSRDAQAALRDISQAAEAITSLARLLERNPGALIRGR